MSAFHSVVKAAADMLANDIDAGAAPTLYCLTEPIPPGSYVGIDSRLGLKGAPTLSGRTADAMRLRGRRATVGVRRAGDGHDDPAVAGVSAARCEQKSLSAEPGSTAGVPETGSPERYSAAVDGVRETAPAPPITPASEPFAIAQKTSPVRPTSKGRWPAGPTVHGKG